MFSFPASFPYAVDRIQYRLKTFNIRLVDGHPVLYFLHAVNIFDKLGDQVLFCCIFGFAPPTVTTPRFVATVVLMALVER